MKRIISRVAAVSLCLVTLLTAGVQALTPEQAVKLLDQFYIDEVPESVLERSTVSDMLDALGDPYTKYFSPEEYQDFLDSMSDTSLVGIGIVYSTGEDGLLISRVLEGSPAEKGGLQADDVIVAVDDKSTKGVSADETSAWIQGEEGTKVRITYRRGNVRRTITLTRALVVVPATTSELLDGHIGYISCTTFGEETVDHFREAIEAYGDEADRWIVDLRDNYGGSTTAATEAAGLFTGPGEMAYFLDSSNQVSVFYHEEESLTDCPVIVLINENSASSSEIFAGAIQSTAAGILIGSRSFGKGVAQTVLDKDVLPKYFSDGDAIKITAYRFFTAGGNTTDQVGVIPDLLTHPEVALDLACLLCGSADGSGLDNPLRIDLGYAWPWQWFVDLDAVRQMDSLILFTMLLDALPTGTDLWLREGDDWIPATLEEVCGLVGILELERGFPDLDDSDHPYILSVLQDYELIHGRDDGLYHPKDFLTRAELCQMLAEALNCSVPANPSPYSDVSDDAWYAPAVTAMSNMGVVNGVGDGLFRPEDPVDHQQFLTIMGRLARRLNFYFDFAAEDMPEEALEMEELADYAAWSRTSVWLLSYSQSSPGQPITMLWDDAANISADGRTTRDEAAFVLYNILSYIGILPV